MTDLKKQFERLSKNGFFVPENWHGSLKDDCAVQYGRAIRTKEQPEQGRFKTGRRIPSTRTHNIQLNDNQIWWESNSNSEGWYIEFDNASEARDLFEKVTGVTVIRKTYKNV